MTMSYPDFVAAQGQLITTWQTYLDQQRALDSGAYDYVTATPPGQPGPGYYPITDPAGVVWWRKCDQRKAIDAAQLNYLRIQLGVTAGYTSSSNNLTLTQAHNGTVIELLGGTTSTAVTVHLTNTPLQGFSCSIIQMGSGQVGFVLDANVGTPLKNPRSHNTIFAQESMATVIVRQRRSDGINFWGLFGDTKIV
jgi:hypothetical protein